MENPRGQKHIIEADKLYMRMCDGHVFIAPSIQHNLSRLNLHEVPMIEFWLDNIGKSKKPNVFAGEPPSE